MVGCDAAPKSEENVGPATGAVKQNRLCVEDGNGADRLSAKTAHQGRISYCVLAGTRSDEFAAIDGPQEAGTSEVSVRETDRTACTPLPRIIT
jgi:hypothetical protein